MTTLPVVERMKPRAAGVETWMRMQYADRVLSDSIQNYPTDYANSPPVAPESFLRSLQMNTSMILSSGSSMPP